jgi:hypothetical protein
VIDRLPHVREPSSGEPDVCVHCLEEWVDLLTLYERDECSVRLRGAFDAERVAVVSALERWAEDGGDPWMSHCADRIKSGEHRCGEKP